MAQRIAIIDGCRTPFSKAWTDLNGMSALDLAKVATKELINKTELDTKQLDEVIMGTVFYPAYYSNVAREVVIGLGLPRNIPGFTVTRACASSVQALTNAAESIMLGQNEVIIAGGTESLSQLQIPYSNSVVQSLQKIARAKSVPEKVYQLTSLNIKELLPAMPDIKELSTGFSMGEHAEMMARKNGITREEQDRFTFESHNKASKAMENKVFEKEVVTTYAAPEFTPVSEDNNVRKNPDLEKMATLPPAFDKKYGTVTAANASPLTDGASAILVMSEEKAKNLGYKPKAFIKSYAYASLDPNDQLLLGNAFTIPMALEKAGLTLADIDMVEMHEAFAVQVLATLKALSSKQFAEAKLGRNTAVGEIDPDKLNIYGGSVAIGHPFGATGGRLVTTMANELERTNKKYGLIAICAAGGMSVALILEKA